MPSFDNKKNLNAQHRISEGKKILIWLFLREKNIKLFLCQNLVTVKYGEKKIQNLIEHKTCNFC